MLETVLLLLALKREKEEGGAAPSCRPTFLRKPPALAGSPDKIFFFAVAIFSLVQKQVQASTFFSFAKPIGDILYRPLKVRLKATRKLLYNDLL